MLQPWFTHCRTLLAYWSSEFVTWRVCPVTVKGCWKLHVNLGAILLMGFCGVLAGSLGSVRKPKSISWVIRREKSTRSVQWWWDISRILGLGWVVILNLGKPNGERNKNLCCSSEVAGKGRFHVALCRKPLYWIQHDTTMSTNWAGVLSFIFFWRMYYTFLVPSTWIKTANWIFPLSPQSFLYNKHIFPFARFLVFFIKKPPKTSSEKFSHLPRLLLGKSEVTEGCSWKALGGPLQISVEIAPEDHTAEAQCEIAKWWTYGGFQK